ncbi:MAG: DUF58 domain-containing protein [Chloroflexota bacterium]|nr:DUF58 domain-containing protein [Chloroflexota bacterium]
MQATPGVQSLYSQLFDAEFMRKLERLSLISRKLKAGRMKGERRSPRRGQSVEFADYRTYAAGDDLRRVDWNAYARMERLFLKLFQEEEDITVHILIDASKSMDWGDPNAVTLTSAVAAVDKGQGIGAHGPVVKGSEGIDTSGQNKLVYAKRVAAALGYISLSNLDRLAVAGISKSGVQRYSAVRGKGHAISLLRFVAGIRAEGETDLDTSLRQYASQARFPGLLYVLSDCLVEGAGTEGLKALQAAGHEVHLVHVLAPAEVNPELALMGDLRLRDVETGATQEVSLESGILDLYKQKFEQWQGGIETFSRRRGINYLQVTTDLPFEDLVLQYMRQRGVVG